MSQVKKGARKRLLSLLLTACMLLAMLPAISPSASAASASMSSPNMLVSVNDMYNQWGMWQDGDTENGKYQFSSSSYWRGMIGDAVPISGAVNTSQNPSDYATPSLTWGTLSASTTTWSYSNVTSPQKLSDVIVNPVITTADLIINSTGAAGTDSQVDTIYIKGEYGYAGSGLAVTAKVYLSKNSVTGNMDVVTYAWEVKNTGTTAKVFGLSWNVDTMIGGSNGGSASSTISGDSAPFMAPGTNMWTTANHSGHDLPGMNVSFPTPSTSNALGLKTRPSSGTADYFLYPSDVNIYENSIPSYVYALNPLKMLPGADGVLGTADDKHFTAMIYPYILNDSEWGSSFTKADFMGFGAYSPITPNYGWNTNGSASSLDSGHIVRWDPRVIVPGETVYMGIRYGQGDAELAVAGVLNFLLDNVITEMPVVNNQYDSAYNPFEVIGKVQNDVQNFNDAYVLLTVEKAYLDVDPSVAGLGQWEFDSEDATNKYYKLQLGALPQSTTQFQLNPVLKLVANPVYTDVNPTDGYDGVIANYSLELIADEGLASETTVLHDQTIKLPRLESISVVASVFRDVNGNGSFDGTFEAVSGVNFTLENVTLGSTAGTAVTRNDGTFNALTGLTQGDSYTFTMSLPGSMATDYVIAGVTDNSIGTGGLTSYDLTHLGDGVVEFTVPASITNEIEINLEIELARAAIVEIYPHTGTVTPPAASNYVPGGTSSVEYTTSSGGTFTRSSGIMAIGDIPYSLSFAANSNAVISVTAPQGYRMANGNVITESRIKNNLAPYISHGAYQEYFQLVAGDLRLTGVTGTSGSPTQAADTASIDTSTAEVQVDTTWAGVSAQLDFSVWDSTPTETHNPTNRTAYTWALVSDPSGVVQSGSFSITNGTFTFTGNTGTATVKVTANTAPYLSHEMEIEVVSGTAASYTDIYIARASDTTLARVTDIALIVNDSTDLVVVGVDAPGNKTKLLNSALSFVSNGTSTASLTAASSATSLYNSTLKGLSQGTTTITASYGGMTTNANVLVTSTALTGATIAITPNPVNLTSGGGNVQVTYTLRLSNGDTVPLPASFVTATVADTAIATLASGDTLQYAADGTTTLRATLNASSSVTGSAAVNCSTGGAAVTPLGTLTLVEASGSNTGGFLVVGSPAEYFAFFDTNGNGVYDTGTDTALPWGTANTVFTSANNCFSLAAGTTPNVQIFGISSGVDRLTVTYTYNGIAYSASADIVVYSNGYSYSHLEVTPAITVLNVGNTQTFTVKAVFTNSTGNTQSYTLPSGMYTGSVPSGGSYASMVTGTQNQVKGDSATGEAVYRATLASDASRFGDAKILVIPGGAYLGVTPSPLWIEIGTSESVAYQLYNSGGTAISVPNLTDYVSASIGSQAVASFTVVSGVANIESVKGNAVGRTTLTAYLHGQTATKTITVYVWDGTSGSGIAWNPASLTINAGGTGNSTVYLANSTGTATTTAVNLEHLTSLTVANTVIATIPASPSGTLLAVTGGSVTVTGNTMITATSPAGSADLAVTVNTGTSISGITADPTIIELWPGETKEVTVKNAGTGISLDATQLNALAKVLSNAGENTVAVNTAGTALEITQDTGVPAGGSVNVLTVTLSSQSATVYIVNYTEDPYVPGSTLSLELTLNPDPTWVVRGGAAADTAAILKLTDSAGVVINSITLPAALVSWTANTSTTLPGRISLAASTVSNQTMTISGLTAGAQTYRVTYSGGSSPLSANGNVFVFAEYPSNITSFVFEPDIAVLTPNATQNIRGVITYTVGGIVSTQYVTPVEFPIAVSDLASNDTSTATVSVNGIIRAQSLGTDSARSTYVDGTLIGTLFTGRTDVLVYDPNAVMSIDPASFIIYMPGGSPTTQTIITKLGNYIVPNIFLSYTASNANVSLTAGGVADYDVTGVSAGTTTITSLLRTTTKSATATAEVRDPNVTYYTVDYNANGGGGTMQSYSLASGSSHNAQPNGFTAPVGDYFTGWNTAADGSGTAYSVGAPITVTANVTLYAQWSAIPPTSYTVTYYSNGGGGAMAPETGMPGASYTVQQNGFTEPVGMQFKQWNTVSDGSGTGYDPNDTFTLNSDVALYAIWENLYTVTYDANGGSGTMTQDTDVQGATYTVQSNGFAAPVGMQFKEWNTLNDGSGTSYDPNDTFTLNSDITLYAIWETITGTTYDITGTVTDGTDPIPGATVTITDGTSTYTGTTDQNGDFSITVPDGSYTVTVTMPDYTDGTATVTVNGADEDVGTIILNALYTVAYDGNGEDGGSAPVDNSSYIAGGSVTLSGNTGNLTKSGYTFIGWALSSAGTGQVYAAGSTYIMGSQDVTFYAVWDDNSSPTYYSLTVQANTGGSVDTTASGYYQAGESVTITATPNTDYSFDGWTSNNGGTFADSSDTSTTFTMPAGDVTVTASFDYSGGSGNHSITGTVVDENGDPIPGATVTITDGTDTYTGTTEQDGTFSVAVPDGDYTVTITMPGYTDGSTSVIVNGGDEDVGTITLDSILSNFYTVKYAPNGGTGSYSVQVEAGDYHTVLTRSATGTTRSGYTFTGWNTSANGRGIDYEPGDRIVVDEDIILYAQWERVSGSDDKDSGSVSFGGLGTGSTTTYFSGVKSTGSISTILDTVNHYAYITGYPDGTVRPSNNITRAEVATIFFRLLTDDYRQQYWSKKNSFNDVNDDQWFNNAISTLSNAGLISGYSDGSFKPENSITRAEFASMAVRIAKAAGITSGSGNASFTDISGHWAEADIKLAAELGYIKGDGTGTFRPNAYITRAEVMTLINRMLSRQVESEDDLLSGMKTWSDNTADKWYYFDVQEATNSHYSTRKYDDVNEVWSTLRADHDWASLQGTDAVWKAMNK